MGVYKDWYDYDELKGIHQKDPEPWEIGLNALEAIALGYLGHTDKERIAAETKSAESDKIDQTMRASQVQGLLKQHPDINPYDYGDVVRNPGDFNNYVQATVDASTVHRRGQEFIPSKGRIVSSKGEQEMLTYGVGESKRVIDTSLGIIGENDFKNWYAWLLGEEGSGRQVAARHGWKGILNEGNNIDGYVLDEGDYLDLHAKGLVGTLTPEGDDGNFYKLTKNQRDKIVKNLGQWEKGFRSVNQPKTQSEVASMVQEAQSSALTNQQNLKDHPEFQGAYNRTAIWNDFAAPGGETSIVKENAHNGEYEYWTDYIDPETAVMLPNGRIDPNSPTTRYGKDQDEFYEEFPNVYKFMSQNPTIEDAFHAYSNSPTSEALRRELALMPSLNAVVKLKMNDFAKITTQRLSMGLDMQKFHYINDSMVQGEGRDIILDDLRGEHFAFGALFDSARFDRLPQGEQVKLIQKIRGWEKTYADPNHPNFNINVVKFLQLYGFGSVPAGKAIEAILNEIEGKQDYIPVR